MSTELQERSPTDATLYQAGNFKLNSSDSNYKAAGTWASMEWLQNSEVDKLIDDARATTDKAEQATLYKTLQRKLVDLQADVFLQTQTVQHAMDKCLDGFKAVPMQSFDYDFTKYSWTCQ